MADSNPFGARSTADKILAGVDLTGKRFVVTGCSSGIGLETMNALAANGAHVIGLARSLAAAQSACARVGLACTPMECDLSNLDSVAAAAASIRALNVPLDAIVANAGVANLPTLQTRYGVEMQFLVNHVGHFALVNALCDLVRDGTGRIVIVSSNASIRQAPAEGIMFDNLDGRRSYQPFVFYGQSKFAAALYAKELSRRLRGRGIAVNSVHPGATRGTRLNQHLRQPLALILSVAKLFMRSVQRGAATQALLAASPRVTGISGEYWRDCRVADGHPLLNDADLAKRLWDVSERIVTAQTEPNSKAFQAAA
ncbi:MAG TPA: SDR family NAD(P)-dependent oxidoreductase [Steroidobacteraceae bacterium]|jgi:WW domain-containing oxidoreductase|nr:SDR family NAD(P)-dependent oxidoreductase [Steroidobacteraceae bacterium]